MPELDALHIDAHRINEFAAARGFTSAHLRGCAVVPGTEGWGCLEVLARARGKELCVALRAASVASAASPAFCPSRISNRANAACSTADGPCLRIPRRALDGLRRDI